MMPVQRLKKAEELRRDLTNKRLKEIRKIYQLAHDEVAKKIERGTENRRKLEAIETVILNKYEVIDAEIKKKSVEDMKNVSVQVVEDKKAYLSGYGFKDADIEKAFFYVPDRVVKAITTGSVYNEGWSLSESIWVHSKDVQKNINYIIAKGTAQGKSAHDIAKDLEKYVNPTQRKKSRVIEFQKYKRDSQGKIIKDENGKPIPDGRPQKFYFSNCDYNAQRLARTLISHAYQQSFETVNANDPFVTKYIWHSSGQHGRTCQLCLERDGQPFEKNELPLDHPNGMCWFEAYVPYDDNTIDRKLKAWYQSPYGTYPDIDKYARTFLE